MRAGLSRSGALAGLVRLGGLVAEVSALAGVACRVSRVACRVQRV
jgi:hypothetical protein